MTPVTEPKALTTVFAIHRGGPVVVHQPLALADLVAATEAEAKAKDLLARATAPFGKAASTPGTRFFERGGTAVLTGLAGVLTALPTYRLFAPDSATYTLKRFYTDGSVAWLNPATRQSLHDATGVAVVLAVLAGFVAGAVAYCGLSVLKDCLRKKASQETLDTTHLEPLDKLHQVAAEQPLARSLIGEVVASALPTLPAREVCVSRPATKLLERIAAFSGSDELARQREDSSGP